VRELENALVRAAVLSPSGVLGPDHIVLAGAMPLPLAGDRTSSNDTLAAAMRRHVDEILERTGGNKRAAARLLGISRQRLDRILERERDATPKRGRDGAET
jgi:DNA-binding NtrC family response regulator